MTDFIRERAVSRPGHVPCIYCHEPVPAEAFTYWSATRRLVSAQCPWCDRRVTLASSTWRRWSRGRGDSPSTGGAHVAMIVTTASTTCTCGHAYAAHDVVARRYCDASITQYLDRGCICSVTTTQP